MTVVRSGPGAAIPTGVPTLESEILTELVRAQRENTAMDYHIRERRLIGAILRAVAGTAMLRDQSSQTSDPFDEAIKEASVAINGYLHDLDRPFARLEDDILRRLRDVPSVSELEALYHDARDAECVRRRGLIAALLDAATSNTFDRPVADEVFIDPHDIDQQNRSNLAAAIRDFHADRERLDAGRDAKYCLSSAGAKPDGYIEPTTKRDALIWAMVAVDLGDGHPVYNTQRSRCELVAEYVGCGPSSLLKYLQALRGGGRRDDNARFSSAEHQSFRERRACVRNLLENGENGLDLLLPVLRGWHVSALPKASSKEHAG